MLFRTPGICYLKVTAWKHSKRLKLIHHKIIFLGKLSGEMYHEVKTIISVGFLNKYHIALKRLLVVKIKIILFADHSKHVLKTRDGAS